MATFSRRDCKKWISNPTKNPLTKRPLKPFRDKFNEIEQKCYSERDCQIYGLRNKGSSCYADSVLVSLFAKPNSVISKYILSQELPMMTASRRYFHMCHKNPQKDLRYRKRVQNAIINIAQSMRYKGDIKYCTDLRKVLKTCNPPDRFDQGGEKDAKEYLQYIFEIFGMNVAKSTKQTLLTNDLGDIEDAHVVKGKLQTDRLSSLVWDVDAHKFGNMEPKTSLQDMLVLTEDAVFDEDNYATRKFGRSIARYQRRVEVKRLVDTPYLVIHIGRADPLTETTNYKKVGVPETIGLPSGTSLNLSAIVIYRGHHYTSTFRCGGKWYYYDDLGGDAELIGDFETMLEETQVSKRGTLFFYTR